jgi:hypothetical protein
LGRTCAPPLLSLGAEATSLTSLETWLPHGVIFVRETFVAPEMAKEHLASLLVLRDTQGALSVAHLPTAMCQETRRGRLVTDAGGEDGVAWARRIGVHWFRSGNRCVDRSTKGEYVGAQNADEIDAWPLVFMLRCLDDSSAAFLAMREIPRRDLDTRDLRAFGSIRNYSEYIRAF